MQRTGFASLRASGLAAIAAAVLPIVVFYTLLTKQMRDLPIMDDYHAILEFVLVWKSLPTLGSKLAWIFAAQHNDYKLAVLNLITLADLGLTGHINFLVYIVIGNVAVLVVLWQLWRHYFADETDINRRLILFVPVAYLLMQLSYVENLDWPITDIETVGALVFSFAAIQMLLKAGSLRLAMACLFMVLAIFSSANGFMVAPIGVWILLSRRQWAQTGLWLAALAAAIGGYLYQYHRFSVTATAAGVSLGAKLVFFLSLSGAAVENMSRFPVRGAAIVFGVALLAAFVYSFRTRFAQTHPFALYTTIWALLSALMITAGRSGFGITLSLTGRYKLFSDLLMVYVYAFAVNQWDKITVPVARRRVLYAAGLAFTMVLALGSDYFGLKFLRNRQVHVAAGINQFEDDPARNPPMVGLTDAPIPQEEPQHDRVVLNQVLADGFYKLPPRSER